MERVRILFLAANPATTTRLALDEEAREIEAKIRAAEHRDAFELITKWAVRPDDLLQALNQHRPHVVHFSGHGSQNEELLLAGEGGQTRSVSSQALTRLFRALAGDIRVVVLNACYSQSQAEAIAEHVDCVVGMRRAIGDRAAVRFAASFYRALAFGCSIANAFEQGLVSLELEGIGEADTPALIVRRPGVVADCVVLVENQDANGGRESKVASPEAHVASGAQPVPASQNKEAALQCLLAEIFDGDSAGMRQWIRLSLGKGIHDALPGGSVSLSQLAFETVLAVQRHGRADAVLFASLQELRHRWAHRIRDVARLYGIVLGGLCANRDACGTT